MPLHEQKIGSFYYSNSRIMGFYDKALDKAISSKKKQSHHSVAAFINCHFHYVIVPTYATCHHMHIKPELTAVHSLLIKVKFVLQKNCRMNFSVSHFLTLHLTFHAQSKFYDVFIINNFAMSFEIASCLLCWVLIKHFGSCINESSSYAL